MLLLNTLKNIYNSSKLKGRIFSDLLLANRAAPYSESFVNNNNLYSKTPYLETVDNFV